MKLKSLYTEGVAESMSGDIEDFAAELSGEIKNVLSDKTDIEEVVDVVSVLSVILSTNTILGILSKWVLAIMKKHDISKGRAAIEKIHLFSEQMEEDFKAPISRVVSLFVKDKKNIDAVTNGIFLVVLLSLAFKCGADVYREVMKSNVVSAIITSVKTITKGIDIMAIIKRI